MKELYSRDKKPIIFEKNTHKSTMIFTLSIEIRNKSDFDSVNTFLSNSSFKCQRFKSTLHKTCENTSF